MSLEAAVAEATGSGVASLRRVGGGDINDAYRVELEDGRSAFVKTRADAPPGEYAAEAAALAWLAEPGAIGVPDVLGVVGSAARAGVDGDRRAARRRGAARRGSRATCTPPARSASAARLRSAWARPLAAERAARRLAEFYAERRLRPLLSHRCSRRAPGRSSAVCDRMADLAGPPEPPARLHGDLWSGNVLWTGGRPWLIDPVAYGGHREVDLAMLQLFGSPGPRFFAAYEEVAPLADGWRERVPLYQLFPLLVHAALFGGGYASSVERAAARYV